MVILVSVSSSRTKLNPRYLSSCSEIPSFWPQITNTYRSKSYWNAPLSDTFFSMEFLHLLFLPCFSCISTHSCQISFQYYFEKSHLYLISYVLDCDCLTEMMSSEQFPASSMYFQHGVKVSTLSLISIKFSRSIRFEEFCTFLTCFSWGCL